MYTLKSKNINVYSKLRIGGNIMQILNANVANRLHVFLGSEEINIIVDFCTRNLTGII